MEITLYRWSKYRNSTKQPPSSAKQVTVTGEFKTGYSILHPVLKLSRTVQFMTAKNPYWNYAYSDTTHYYYFVRNWVYESGFWVAYLDYDPLASWKSQILDKNYYVLRSGDPQAYNGDIIDPTYQTRGGSEISVTRVNNQSWLDIDSNGSYVLGVINDIGQSLGAITYYVMAPNEISTFFSRLLSSVSWANISTTEISQQLQKALINPMQYVASLTWLPVDRSTISNLGSGTLKVGWWEMDSGSWSIANAWMSKDFTISLTIPRHPQAASRGAYLNLSPYSQYTLNFYPFGTITIDSTDIYNASTLYCFLQVEIITGQAVLSISADNDINHAFRKIKAQLGVQIPLGQININLQALAGGASDMVQGIVGASAAAEASPSLVNTGKKLLGDIRQVISTGGYADRTVGTEGIANPIEVAANIGNTAMAALSTAEFRPAAGSFLDAGVAITLVGKFLRVVNNYPAYIGRPLCEYRTLISLSGFCKCQLAWPDLEGATMQEQEDIASYLNGGFYIE